jgi:hypothetical protein
MPKLILDGDSRGAVRAMADLKGAVAAGGTEFEKSARSARELEKAAARIVKENQGPQERYNSKIKELSTLVRQGKLSFEQAGVAAGRYRQELDGTSRSTNRLLTTIGGFASATAVIGKVTEALTAVGEAARKSAQDVVNAVGPLGELQQVATSPQDFAKLVGQARGFISSGTFRGDQFGQAADVAFALRNAQYSDADVGFIQQLGTSKQVKPENLIRVAEGLKKYQDIFGVAEAGGIEAVGRKVWRAAGSTQSDFSTVAKAATLFGSEASALKYSDEEALAAFIAIEKASPGPEEAATRLRSMLTQIAKRGLSKGTLTDTVGSLVDRVKRGETAIGMLGETRAAAGLNILAAPDRHADYRAQLASITAAQNQDIIRGSTYFRADPSVSAAAALQREQGAYDSMVEESYSPQRNIYEAILSGRTRRAAERGKMDWFFEELGQKTAGWLVPKEQVIRGEARGGFQHVSPETAVDIQNYLMRQLQSLESIDKKMDSLKSLDSKTRRLPVLSGRQE